MTFEKLPYGSNLSSAVYDIFESWVVQTQYTNMAKAECEAYKDDEDETKSKCNCVGCLTVFGKSVAVAPAHLLMAVVAGPALFIYDFVMSIFFFLANLCTAFVFDELRERLGAHLSSMAHQPLESAKHLFAALVPPLAYRSEEALAVNKMNNDTSVLFDNELIKRRMLGFQYQRAIVACRSSDEDEAGNAKRSLRDIGRNIMQRERDAAEHLEEESNELERQPQILGENISEYPPPSFDLRTNTTLNPNNTQNHDEL